MLLDLFCCQGGAGMGYHRAGFDVVGVDINPQPRYPFRFVQADALEFLARHGHEFDAIHASPPCQAFCALKGMPNYKEHPNLIPQTRALLRATGKPYVIENVPGAPLENAVMLCGTMFGLCTKCGAELRRHRLFETNWLLLCGLTCRHGKVAPRAITVTGHTAMSHSSRWSRRRTITVTGSTAQQNVVRNEERETFDVRAAQEAMGIDWMPMKGLSQAIPPSYTEFIGRQLAQEIGGKL